MTGRVAKGLVACVLVVLLPLGGRGLRPAFPARIAAPPLDVTDPASFPAEDLSAWVLQTNDSLTVPAALLSRSSSAALAFSRSSIDRRSVANRNRNPLNIKFGSDTQWYVELGLATISEITPLDGGWFLRFGSPEAGFRAAVTLLKTSAYTDLKVDQALRKWSNNGYGAGILRGTRLDAQKIVSCLGTDELRILLTVMAAFEGYASSTLSREIEKALALELE